MQQQKKKNWRELEKAILKKKTRRPKVKRGAYLNLITSWKDGEKWEFSGWEKWYECVVQEMIWNYMSVLDRPLLSLLYSRNNAF